MSFAQASRIVAAGDGRFTWDVPDGWQQGKGAFGGLVLGALARAMEALEPDRERRLRVLTGELCAPMLVGPTEIVATVLRRGRATSFLEARAIQGGEVIARASAMAAAARPPSALRTVEVAPPALPGWQGMPVAPLGAGPAPVFTQHYEYRLAGPVPFSGAAEPVTAGWIRERGQPGPLDAAALVALCDGWWPCALVVERGPRAMATVAFTAELLVDPASLDPMVPLAYRAHLAGASDGFSVELRHLWQGDRLVALNQQTFAAL